MLNHLVKSGIDCRVDLMPDMSHSLTLAATALRAHFGIESSNLLASLYHLGGRAVANGIQESLSIINGLQLMAIALDALGFDMRRFDFSRGSRQRAI